jgi:hypothetical protein
MSGISDYFMDLIADNISNRSEIPATIYIALVTEEPMMGTAGTNLLEPPAGVGYSRQAYTMSSANWSAASTGSISSLTNIQFTTNAMGIWGTLVAWVACTASTGGSVLFWGTLDNRVYVNTGAIVSLPVGAIEISVEPNSQAVVG